MVDQEWFKRFFLLTPAEHSVLYLKIRNFTRKEMAAKLVCSVKNVEQHLTGIADKLGIGHLRDNRERARLYVEVIGPAYLQYMEQIIQNKQEQGETAPPPYVTSPIQDPEALFVTIYQEEVAMDKLRKKRPKDGKRRPQGLKQGEAHLQLGSGTMDDDDDDEEDEDEEPKQLPPPQPIKRSRGWVWYLAGVACSIAAALLLLPPYIDDRIAKSIPAPAPPRVITAVPPTALPTSTPAPTQPAPVMVVTATPLPATPTPNVPTATPAPPTATPKPTESPKPTPLPQTKAVGENWTSQGVSLALINTYLGTNACGGSNCRFYIYMQFRLTNQTNQTISFEAPHSRFFVDFEDSQHFSGLPSETLTFDRIAPGRKEEFSVHFQIESSQYEALRRNSRINYMIVGVKDFSRISEAYWKEDLAH